MKKFFEGVALGVLIGTCLLATVGVVIALASVLPLVKVVAVGGGLVAGLIGATSMAFAGVSGLLALVHSALGQEDEADECLDLARRCLLLGLSGVTASYLNS